MSVVGVLAGLRLRENPLRVEFRELLGSDRPGTRLADRRERGSDDVPALLRCTDRDDDPDRGLPPGISATVHEGIMAEASDSGRRWTSEQIGDLVDDGSFSLLLVSETLCELTARGLAGLLEGDQIGDDDATITADAM